MKKTSILLALALLAVMLAPAALAANSGKCGASINWSLNTSTKTLTISGSGRMYDYSSNNLPPWYSASTAGANLETVVISGEITYIGNYAFYKLSKVASFSLPDTVLEIGEKAFYFNGLRQIHLSSRLEIIGYMAFYYCSSLQSIEIPNRVHTIGASAFEACTRATTLTLPDDLTTVGNSAFSSCSRVTSLTLPEKLEAIDSSAFYGMNGLTEVTIPASVTAFGHSVFASCKSLQAIHVDSGNLILSSVGGILFDKAGATLIQYPAGRPDESYTIPNTVSQLGDSAFSGCQYLERVTVPNSVAKLSNFVFAHCAALTDVELPNTLTLIDDRAFFNCGALTDLVIPDGVTGIGMEAFAYDANLVRLTVPESVTSFGERVFDDCSADLTLRVIAGSPAHTYAVNNNMNIEFDSPFDRVDFVLPDDLTVIEKRAFSGIAATAVRIPDGVTSIGGMAFGECPNLKHVYIPDSIPEGSIADNAFNGNSGLYLYGSEGGYAQSYAASHDSITFIPLDP